MGRRWSVVIMYQKDDTLLRRGFSDNTQQQQSSCSGGCTEHRQIFSFKCALDACLECQKAIYILRLAQHQCMELRPSRVWTYTFTRNCVQYELWHMVLPKGYWVQACQHSRFNLRLKQAAMGIIWIIMQIIPAQFQLRHCYHSSLDTVRFLVGYEHWGSYARNQSCHAWSMV